MQIWYGQVRLIATSFFSPNFTLCVTVRNGFRTSFVLRIQTEAVVCRRRIFHGLVQALGDERLSISANVLEAARECVTETVTVIVSAMATQTMERRMKDGRFGRLSKGCHVLLGMQCTRFLTCSA